MTGCEQGRFGGVDKRCGSVNAIGNTASGQRVAMVDKWITRHPNERLLNYRSLPMRRVYGHIFVWSTIFAVLLTVFALLTWLRAMEGTAGGL